MSLVDKVKEKLANLPKENEISEDEALQEAERLSELFKDVTPKPFYITTDYLFGVPKRSGQPRPKDRS